MQLGERHGHPKWPRSSQAWFGMVWGGLGWFGGAWVGLGVFGMLWDGLGWFGVVWV